MLHMVPDVWGKLLERGLHFVQRRRTSIWKRSKTPFVLEQTESPNTSPQAIELNQAARSKPIPTGLAPVPGIKTRNLEAFS